MNKIFSLIIILIVLMSSVAPALAANEKIAKEPVKASKAISKAPAELKDKIKAESTKADAIEITKDKSGIRMKADLPKGQDKVEITLTKDSWKDIPNCNGEYFYAHHFLDDGTYDGYQKVYMNKKGDTVFTATFSETILNGFSGYYQVTQTLSSGQSLTLPDGADRVEVSVGGSIPEYVAIVEDDVSTYPNTPTFLTPMNNETDVASNTTVTNTNTIFSNSAAIFDGASFLSYDNFFTSHNMSIGYSFHRTGAGSGVNPGIVSQKIGGFGFVYVPNSGNTVITRIYNTNNTYVQLPAYTITNGQRYNVTLTINNNSKKILQYVDGVQISETTYTGTLRTGGTGDFFVANQDTEYLNGSVYNIFGYDGYVLSPEQVGILNSGFSGIQISSTPYLGGTLTLSPTTSVEYVATDGIAREVTARAFFTEDTTIINNVASDQYQNLTITHTTGSNQTNGTISFPYYSSYTGTATLESNNTNASVLKSGNDIVISTGSLVAGETFYYNVSIPIGDTGTVNPPFTKATGGFVALVSAFAVAAFSFSRRRR